MRAYDPDRKEGNMTTRKIALVAVLAIAGIPAGALAAKPAHPTTPASTNASTNASTHTSTNAAKPTVMFVLRGTLSKYTAANGTTNGAITLVVSSSNYHGKTLKSQTLAFTVSSKTNVVLHDGKPIADGDHGIVKVRAPKGSSAATLSATAAAEVIDQGPPA